MRTRYSIQLHLAVLLALAVWVVGPAAAAAEPAVGTIRGTVTLESNGGAVHKAVVLIVQLGRTTETGDDGTYEFKSVPTGQYEVVVRSVALSSERQKVTVTASGTVTADFVLSIASLREVVTVTGSGREETAFESFQSVDSIDTLELAQKTQTALGDVLDGQTGVAKRSFGVGNDRPVIRGFDGDRVLVMTDGLNISSLASQSGDHGEPLNVLDLERVEVVRGPATLLYGANAIGGVVNAISGHFGTHEHPHPGWSGYLTGTGGSNNGQGGGAGGFEYGSAKWDVWGGGAGQRTGDYDAPTGPVVNSRTRNASGYGGAGWYGDRSFFSGGYSYDNFRYGIPFAAFLEDGPPFDPAAEVVNLRLRRHDVKFNGGFRNLEGPLSGARATLGYVRYRHGEFDGDTLATDFTNNVFGYRVTFDQRRWGKLTGSFGFSGAHRDYTTVGAEALAPPVVLNNFALYTLQTVDLERISFQFGGRFEHNGYATSTSSNFPVPPPDRSFNGFSGAAGVRIPLWKGGAFVTNYAHSFRAPALEELYNNGAHPGNVAFEIGDPNLRRERGDGVDISLRQQSGRVQVEANYFYYKFSDYVFLTPTGNIQDGLPEAEYLQGGTRYLGGEFRLMAQLHRYISLRGGVDAVKAELTRPLASTVTGLITPAGTPLPRIPPVRGRIGLDFRWKGFSLSPEGVFARDQNDIFPTETRTAGYALFNLNASYTIARQHYVQVFSLTSFNLTDTLYRNHLSFIKNLAPEIGAGVRFGYTLRFF